MQQIVQDIQRLLSRQIIEFAIPSEVQYISSIFSRLKKDGSIGLILNLKYHHFKMETSQEAIQLLSKGSFLASVDLKDAYFSVPVGTSYSKVP